LACDIRPADPRDPGLAELIRRHAAHGDAHYPAESNHHLSPDDLARSGIAFFAMWDGDRPVAMGALAPLGPDAAEIKSMHVTEDRRGTGLGVAILSHLIATARGTGLRSLWLETGSREASAAARAIYAREGFRACPPFGEYVEDPESVFMVLHFD
jgi:putative acetyltransferase